MWQRKVFCLFTLLENQVLKAKTVKLMYFCLQSRDGYGLSVSRCFSIALCLFACVCIAGLAALRSCAKRGTGGEDGLTRVCLSVPGGLSEMLPRRIVLLSECWYAALTDNSLQFAGLCCVID